MGEEEGGGSAGAEGHEGHEGYEEGHEGHESQEGDEGHEEGHEGYEGHEGDEGNEEGDEGHEGHEGDEGQEGMRACRCWWTWCPLRPALVAACGPVSLGGLYGVRRAVGMPSSRRAGGFCSLEAWP